MSNNANILDKGNWHEDIYQYLQTIIPSSPGLAAFDFDNTLVKNDFGEAVMEAIIADGLERLQEDFASFFPDREKADQIRRQKEISGLRNFIMDHYDALLAEKGLEQAYRWSSFLFSGWSENDLKKKSREVWENDTSVFPYKEMQNLIQFLVHHGWDVMIVTSSPLWIIQEVAGEYGLRPDQVIGMEMELDNSKTTSRIIEPYPYGQGKVAALKMRKGKYADIAFGDSINDYPLLGSAQKKGFLIDKGNDELRKKCAELGNFTQPVFL